MFGQLFIYLLLMQPAAGDSTIVLRNANCTISVDIAVGGRVTSLQVNGDELLGSSAIHPRFYGSSLWLSPEGKWKGMGLLDGGPYQLGHGDKGSVVVSSRSDTVRGFSFVKEFRINEKDSSFAIRYTIANTAKVDQEVAPWEVTRVPTGGLAFFPSGAQPQLAKSDLPVRESAAMVWYPYDSVSKQHQKLFRHGAEGWTAYVRGRNIFIKQYPVMAPGLAAPGEENVEMYANPEKTYIELENQGPYQRLAPGAHLEYEVNWFARRLPDNIRVAEGEAALVAYVRALIAAHGKRS